MAAVLNIVDSSFFWMALNKRHPARVEANMAYDFMFFRETLTLVPATADPTTDIEQWTRTVFFRIPEVASMNPVKFSSNFKYLFNC